MEDLWRIVNSMKAAAEEAGVPLVTGDTKVVDRGKGDGVYVNTSGIGLVPAGVQGRIGEHRDGIHDLVIVGAGPAGIAASLAAMSRKLDFVTLEQDTLGGTVSHYPRGKIVMTAPADLPVVGKMQFKETTKEALMDFWQGVVEKTGLEIKDRHRVESIEQDSGQQGEQGHRHGHHHGPAHFLHATQSRRQLDRDGRGNHLVSGRGMRTPRHEHAALRGVADSGSGE